MTAPSDWQLLVPLTFPLLPQKASTMLGAGFKAERLRVNLRLVINRLKLLEKKKSEYLRGQVQPRMLLGLRSLETILEPGYFHGPSMEQSFALPCWT